MTATATPAPKPLREKTSPPPEPTSVTASLLRIPLESIDIGTNVREHVDTDELAELAESIRAHGVIQPVKLVAAAGDRKGRYDLVYGQRRVLASRLLAEQAAKDGRPAPTHILALVEQLASDVAVPGPERSIEQLVENLHRKDLNPLDRARAMKAVVESGVKQVDLAKQLGLAPSTIANDLRLLEAAPEVQAMLEEGSLTPGHSRAIQALEPDLQADFAEQAKKGGWSAHETERQAKYAAENAKRIREAKALAERRLAEAEELLAKVTTRDKAAVAIADYGGSQDVKALLAKAGWNVIGGWEVAKIANAGSCGCPATWRIEVPYNDKQKLTLTPGCSDKEHQAAARARQQAENEAQYAREREAAEAKRRVEEEAADRRQAGLVKLLVEQPADPFVQRLAIAAVAGYDLPELLEIERDRNDDGDGPWEALVAVDDARLPELFANAVAGALDESWWNAEGLHAAIDARIGLAEPEAAEGVTWFALRKSPHGGYTPAHQFPASVAIKRGTFENGVATCGFDANQRPSTGGGYDMLVDPGTTHVKAAQKQCPKCLKVSIDRNREALDRARAAAETPA